MEQYIQEKVDNSNDNLFEKNNYNFNNMLSKQSNNYKYCENILDFESNDSIIKNNYDKIILKKKKLILSIVRWKNLSH